MSSLAIDIVKNYSKQIMKESHNHGTKTQIKDSKRERETRGGGRSQLLDVLREPAEAFAVAHFADDAAHEDLHGAKIRAIELDSSLAGSEVGEAEVVLKFLFGGGVGDVDLVPQNEERNAGQRFVRKKPV